MADFLKDNIEAERRRMPTGDAGMSGLPQASRREVPDILSWLHSYSMFAAIVSAKYPHKARELWAYQAIMIGEARRCGGRGWSLYDAAFRQQITSYEAANFARINQSLYSTTFLAYGGRGQCCQTCLASDHAHEDCALHPGRNVPVVRMGLETMPRDSRARRGEARRGRSRQPCYAWNDGRCVLPYCRFEHICSRCFGPHKKAACRGRDEAERNYPARESERAARN